MTNCKSEGVNEMAMQIDSSYTRVYKATGSFRFSLAVDSASGLRCRLSILTHTKRGKSLTYLLFVRLQQQRLPVVAQCVHERYEQNARKQSNAEAGASERRASETQERG